MEEKTQYPYLMRSTILKAAKNLFDHKGYDSTSLADISELLSIDVQVILVFFQSKDQLLEAVWSES